MNHVTLIGRLTKDPELRYTQGGTAVASFTLAINRPKKKDKEQEADFIPCVVWGSQAENAAKYILKGSQVAVEGRIQVRTYEDKDKSRRWVTEVISNRLQYLDKKKGPQTIEEMGKEVEFTDDDIPF